MSKKILALKRALNAAKNAMGPQQHGVHDKPFVCGCCGHDRFTVGAILILQLHTLICAECSHIEFFAKRPPML